jgi:hypothetical protein
VEECLSSGVDSGADEMWASCGAAPVAAVHTFSASRITYAFSPRLRFGRYISPRGFPLAPASTMTNTSVGALYRSSDPRHGGAEATIGGIVVRTETSGQRHCCGLTLGLIWDGQPKLEREPLPSCFPAAWSPFQNFPVLDRGEGEVVLRHLRKHGAWLMTCLLATVCIGRWGP